MLDRLHDKRGLERARVLTKSDVGIRFIFIKVLCIGALLTRTPRRQSPKCPYYQGVRMKRALRKNVPDTSFIDTKTKTDLFVATKRFVTAARAN